MLWYNYIRWSLVSFVNWRGKSWIQTQPSPAHLIQYTVAICGNPACTNKNKFSGCWDSTTCEPLDAIRAEFDEFWTKFRARRRYHSIQGMRFPIRDFNIDLARSLHHLWDHCCQNVKLTTFFHTPLVFLRRICDHRILSSGSASTCR